MTLTVENIKISSSSAMFYVIGFLKFTTMMIGIVYIIPQLLGRNKVEWLKRLLFTSHLFNTVFNAIDYNIIWLSVASYVIYTQYFEGYLDWYENLWNRIYILLNIQSVNFRADFFITPRFGCIFELKQTSPHLSVLLYFSLGFEWELLKWFSPKYWHRCCMLPIIEHKIWLPLVVDTCFARIHR